MPSHRDAPNTALEVLRSCSVLAKNCPLACRSFLVHSSSQELCALSIWLKPVLRSSQALKVPRLSGRKRRECIIQLSAFGGDRPPGRQSAHDMIAKNGVNNLAMGSRTKLAPETFCAPTWMFGLLREREPLLHGPDGS